MLGNLTSFLGKRVSETLPPEEWLTLAIFSILQQYSHLFSSWFSRLFSLHQNLYNGDKAWYFKRSSL